MKFTHKPGCTRVEFPEADEIKTNLMQEWGERIFLHSTALATGLPIEALDEIPKRGMLKRSYKLNQVALLKRWRRIASGGKPQIEYLVDPNIDNQTPGGKLAVVRFQHGDIGAWIVHPDNVLEFIAAIESCGCEAVKFNLCDYNISTADVIAPYIRFL